MDQLVMYLIASALLLVLATYCMSCKERYGLTPYLECVTDCQTNGNRPQVLMDDGDYPTEYCIQTCSDKFGGVSTLM